MEFVIHRFERLGSTNDEAKARARGGAPEGTVVVAAEQTSGRGTKGRVWHSAPGLGLYVSVVLRPPLEFLSLLPLAAGLAAREAAEVTGGVRARLKWPNDIVWKGRKLGGVLCESVILGASPGSVVVGLGLNVGHGPGDLPGELERTAVSIRSAGGRGVGPGEMLDSFLPVLARWVGEVRRGRGGEAARAFAGFSETKPGDRISLSTPSGTIAGLYAGLAPDGALLLRIAGEERRITSGEIVRAG